ncbi:MAG: hypothetical protein IH987_15050 [Planctomycetes bacterium]|nr:hypothetical protein [Planctomycetota bacterium]
MIESRGGELREYDAKIVRTAYLINRDWLGTDDRDLAKIEALRKQIDCGYYGIREQSLAALRQFESEDNLKLLLGLPDKLMQEARTGDRGGRRATVTAQSALAIELLLAAPMKTGDLVRLRHDRSFNCLDGPSGPLYAVIPKDESAVHKEQAYALPEHTRSLLMECQLRYMPPVQPGVIPWLFPKKSGGCKSGHALRQQLKPVIFRHTGLTMTPQQFRHLAAKLILEAEPGAFELVRQLLGQSRYETARTMYGHLETRTAVRQYDQLLSRLAKATHSNLGA